MPFSTISPAASKKSGIDPISETTIPMLITMFSKELEGRTEMMFPGTVPSTGNSFPALALSSAKIITNTTPITMYTTAMMAMAYVVVRAAVLWSSFLRWFCG